MDPAPAGRVVALVVSHDGARWLPSVLRGCRRSAGPGPRRRRRHRQQGRQRRPARRRRRRRPPGSVGHLLPAAVRHGLERPAPPTPSGSGCSTTTPTPLPTRWPSCSPRPPPTPRPTCSAPSCASGPRCAACSRWASPSPAPAAARRVWSAASTTRASTTTYAGARRQHRRHARAPLACWRTSAASTSSCRLRQRHRLRLARRGGRAQDDRRALGRGVPRRGRPPRRAPYAADRAAHPLPGAPGRPLHAAGQHPRPVAAWQVLRLGLGTLLRVVGFLLVRAVGQALDELAALVSLYGSPGQIMSARRDRKRRTHRTGRRPRPAGALVGALPPRPRRGQRPGDGPDPPGPGRRRAPPGGRRRGRGRSHPVSPRRRHHRGTRTRAGGRHRHGRSVPDQPGGRRRRAVRAAGARRRPRGDRPRQRRRAVRRTRTARATCGGCYAESWHPLGQGTRCRRRRTCCRSRCSPRCSAAASVAAVSAILLLAVPLALWGAWRFLRVVGHLADAAGAPRWLLAVASATYALVPVVSGAWGDGRLGIVVVAAVLPWLGHAALGFADPEPDRRWRAAWRSALLLALVAAFTPVRLVLRRRARGGRWSASPS